MIQLISWQWLFKNYFQERKLQLDPVIENGFYYDFARKATFYRRRFKKIEEKMKEIVDRDEITKREVWERDKAKATF